MIPIKPTGYRILVKQVIQRAETNSGLTLYSDEEHTRQQAGFPIYEVLAMGDACYKNRGDFTDFQEGPWCKVGDMILCDSYAGKVVRPSEFERLGKHSDEEIKELREMDRLKLKFHIISDDAVMGVIS